MNRPPDEQLSRLLPFEVESFVFRTAKLLIQTEDVFNVKRYLRKPPKRNFLPR
ncbi:MAG: hypothetical protein ACTS7I_01210 [Candidatus Hodgkinia cicadicola]